MKLFKKANMKDVKDQRVFFIETNLQMTMMQASVE